ncbi:MAG: transposase [Burkholderiales bacterium]|nr:transposase [Burkholderiales bacterium]
MTVIHAHDRGLVYGARMTRDLVIDALRMAYNTRRPHQSLDGATPESVHFNSLPLPLAA